MRRKYVIVLSIIVSIVVLTVGFIIFWSVFDPSESSESTQQQLLYCESLKQLTQGATIKGVKNDTKFGTFISSSTDGKVLYTLSEISSPGFIKLDRNVNGIYTQKSATKYLDNRFPFIVSNFDSSLILVSSLSGTHIVNHVYNTDFNELASLTISRETNQAGIPFFDSSTSYYQGYPGLNIIYYYHYSSIPEQVLTITNTIVAPPDVTFFGSEIYISNNYLLVQASDILDTSGLTRSNGVLCIFSRVNTSANWNFLQTLKASDVTTLGWTNVHAQFGKSFTLFNNQLFVSCNATINGTTNAGGIVLFSLLNNKFEYIRGIAAPTISPQAFFGNSVTLIQTRSITSQTNYIYIISANTIYMYLLNDTLLEIVSTGVAPQGTTLFSYPYTTQEAYANNLNTFIGSTDQITQWNSSCLENRKVL